MIEEIMHIVNWISAACAITTAFMILKHMKRIHKDIWDVEKDIGDINYELYRLRASYMSQQQLINLLTDVIRDKNCKKNIPQKDEDESTTEI
jgi:hypothetical protein